MENVMNKSMKFDDFRWFFGNFIWEYINWKFQFETGKWFFFLHYWGVGSEMKMFSKETWNYALLANSKLN